MTARFTLTRVLDCPAETAWRLLTDPEQMNKWSTARIDLVDGGPGDRPDTAGALRMVTLPDGKRKLREVVEYADEPRSSATASTTAVRCCSTTRASSR